jgi:hypothetical protein
VINNRWAFFNSLTDDSLSGANTPNHFSNPPTAFWHFFRQKIKALEEVPLGITMIAGFNRSVPAFCDLSIFCYISRRLKPLPYSLRYRFLAAIAAFSSRHVTAPSPYAPRLLVPASVCTLMQLSHAR